MLIHAPAPEVYRDFAEAAAEESPCFADWARGVVDDPDVLAWLDSLPAAKRQPNLVFAAARWHGVPAPGPYAGLRAALLEDGGAIRRTILERSTQTNEVGRLASLLPALAGIAAATDRPLALVELGASAGLTLYPDRMAYRWSGEASRSLDPEPGEWPPAPVLPCETRGPVPLPAALPAVAWRGGIDLNPLEVTDDDQMAWLATLVWPEHEDRRARLAAATAVARHDPPVLVRGDLIEELGATVATAARHGEVVVMHSAVAAYLEEDRRRALVTRMLDLVRRGECHWVSNEGPLVLPEVTSTGPAMPPGRHDFVLGLDGRATAWAHGHGRRVEWL